MSDEATNARAEAKAAKARAKALRPWFKKKRFWALGLIAAIVVIAAVSSGGSDSTETTSSGASQNADSSSEASSSDTISKGLGSKDASADIDSISCRPPDAIGAVYVDVKITNNSSKPSDYFVTVVAESADGSVRYDDTIVSATALNPGQTTTVEGIFLQELGEGAVCKVTEVQRTAS